MRKLTTALFSLFMLLASPVFAGAGHDHGHGHSHDPVTKAQAEEIATKTVAKLVNRGKIDESWNAVGVSTSEQKKFGKNMEWVIVFINKQVADPEKQTLYIFLTLTGEYLAANYTGN